MTPLLLYNDLFPPLITVFGLTFILSDISITTPVFLEYHFAWNIFFYPFIPFSTLVSLAKPCISIMESENVKAMRNLRYYMAECPCIFIESLVVAPRNLMTFENKY